ncbi:MAG: efflux RND transporter periplasmic adaptor subunit [Desulfurivibrio sp.]|nr:efflux RND transporter periplasmic adaptor subunit [Desulfurivibrio sp.]
MRFFKYLVPLLVLLAGLLAMLFLLNQRQPPQPEERATVGALVEVREVSPTDHRVTVHTTGTVQARREIAVVPEVSGRVVELGENFVAGGFVEQGELLFKIEPADYQLALRRTRAAVKQAEVKLATTRQQAATARHEWQQFGDGAAPPSPLALYQPQLDEARAAVAAAEADLAAAQLNLERTVLRAPFNGRIRQRELEIGQYLPAGARVAVLTGTDAAEVVTPVPMHELPWLAIPPGTEGSSATVSLEVGGRRQPAPRPVDPQPWARWSSGEDGAGGDRDRRSLRARAGQKRGLTPFWLPGAFVEVEIAGRRLSGVFALPRRALRQGDKLWLADAEHRLEIRPVEVVRRERRAGLHQGWSGRRRAGHPHRSGRRRAGRSLTPGAPVPIPQHPRHKRRAKMIPASPADKPTPAQRRRTRL